MDDQPRGDRPDGAEPDATEAFGASDSGDDADPTAIVPTPADHDPGSGDHDPDSAGPGPGEAGPGGVDSSAGAGAGDRVGAPLGDTAELHDWDIDRTEPIDLDAIDLGAIDPDGPARASGDAGPPTEAMRSDIDSPTEAMRGDLDSPTQAMHGDFDAPTEAVGQGDEMTGPIDPDATRAVGQPDPDATRAVGQPDLEATQYIPPGQPMPPRPDQTAVQPPLPEGWVGQAQVRPRDPEDDPRAVWVPAAPSHRAWWLPILLGILGLLLVLGIVYGLVVASRNNNPTPTQTPTVPTTPATPTTTPPTTATPSPSVSTAALVTIPTNITSLDINAATQTLQALGLVAKPQPVIVTDPAQVNLVLSTDPAPGSQVQPGSPVTLKYGQLAAPPSSGPPTSGPPSPSPSPS